MTERIPVYEPDLTGNERAYVLDCVDSTWISSRGAYIDKFEALVAKRTGTEHCVAVFNGTVALHLALQCLGIGPGDEVLVPTFTYIASVNSIVTAGAVPVLVESRADDWLMDIEDAARKVTPRTKAIMPVHLYGFACDMEATNDLARSKTLKVVEDAAEALCVSVGGKPLGSDSDVATFSFFGNKTATCGEGGAVVTNSAELADNLRITKNHGMSTTRRYWHDRLGFNYRMTNIQAAIGCAQFERLDGFVRRKQEIYRQFREELKGLPLQWQETKLKGLESSYWLVSMLARSENERDEIMRALEAANIESRPVFRCAHQMPMLRGSVKERFPVAEDIAERGFSVPSYPGLSEAQVSRICDVIKSVMI